MLEIKGLKKTFHLDSNPEHDKVALRGTDLTINEGDFVSVIGSNGSGKTTLLNLIAGVFPADEGSIHLDGQDISKLRVEKRAKFIGRVFQDPMLGTIADMSLFENLSIASRRGKKLSPIRWALSKESEEEFKKLLAPLNLGLEDRMMAPMSTFSGGQRQSVTLLMAALSTPKLLLLDEHTAALDPGTAKKVMELTNSIITQSKVPTLMITHNMKDAIRYGNRLIMMAEGRIIFAAEGEEKNNLTVSDLIAKFGNLDSVPDSAVLG